MTMGRVLLLSCCALWTAGASQKSGACDANDGTCESETSAMLQLTKQQRTIETEDNGATSDPTDVWPCWDGSMSVAEYKKCMASIPLDPTARDCTLSVLSHSLSDVYAYTGLIHDSLDNNAKLAPGYRFKEYNISLRSYIESLWPKLQEETAAGTFVIELGALANKLRDAHTIIRPEVYSKIASRPPFHIVPEFHNGRTVFRIARADRDIAGAEGKIVETVNGMSAIEYFTEVAFTKGPGVKDPSVAINKYLFNQVIYLVIPPQDGEMKIVCTDGTKYESRWMVNFHIGGLCTREQVMNWACHIQKINYVLVPKFTYNPAFTNLALAFMRSGLDLPCGPKPGCPTFGDVMRANPSFSKPWISLAQDPATEEPAEREKFELEQPEFEPAPETGTETLSMNGTRGATGQTQHNDHVYVEQFASADCYVVRVETTGKHGRDVCVLKITEFGSQITEFQKCAVFAAETAEKYCGGDLLLDVLGNGGGSISTGYWLNYFLFFNHPSKPFKRPVDVCSWYQYPEYKVMDQLVAIAQKGTPDLTKQSDPTEFIKVVSNRMRKIVETFTPGDYTYGIGKHQLDSWTNSSNCLDGMLASNGGKAPAKTSWGKPTKEWVAFEAKYMECERISGGVDSTPIGMSKSNMFPNPLTPDPLDWEFYNNPVTQVRGGQERKFTSLSYLVSSCPWHPANAGKSTWQNNVEPTKVLKNVRILSDGTCGSTCSVAITQQYVDGLATVVTYGGLSGLPMDISSFNGGNVNGWQYTTSGLWQSALRSFLDKSIWYPDVKPTIWPFMPVPLAMSAVRFAQRAEMPRAMGPDALPREWYLLPSQYHLNYWTESSLDQNPADYIRYDPKQMEELVHLYKEADSKKPDPFKPGV